MSDDTDALLNELINGKEKPQPKAEVSSFNEPKPELKTKSKDLEFKLVEEEAECASCKTELGEGEKHWVYDDWINKTWWCVTCGWEYCNLTPPEE